MAPYDNPTCLHVNIPRPQRIGLNKVPPWLNIITHQRRKDLIRSNRILDLYFQQAAHGGVHGGFPQLFRVHFAQTFVALFGDGAFGFVAQPLDGLVEVGDGGFFHAIAFAAAHECAWAHQALEGGGAAGQHGVVGALHEVGVDGADFDVAVMHAFDAQQVFFRQFVGAHVHFDGVVVDGRLQGLRRGFCQFQRAQVQLYAGHDGGQGGAVDDAGQTRHDAVRQVELAYQFGQGVAGNAFCAFARHQYGRVQGHRHHVGGFFGVIFQIALVAAGLDLVQRRLRDVDVAALDQLRHLAVEQGQQQGADVGAVDVRIGHDDDAVVAQLFDVEFIRADRRAQRGDQRGDLFRRQHLFEARLFHVQHFTAQRQDGLELAVAALLGRAACRVTLDDVQFAQRRVFFLAVGQLGRQAQAVHDAFAAGQVAGLAGRFARARRFDDLAADDFGVVRFFLQVVGQRLGDDLFDRAAHFGRHQLVLGLRREFRLRHLHGQHAGQAFAHVVAGDFNLGLLGELVLVDVFVDDARHRRAQAGQVGAAVALRDVVGEAQHLLVVGVVPLHRHVHRDVGVLVRHAFAGGLEHGRVQHGLGLVDVFDEAARAAFEGEDFFLAVALVSQLDVDAVVQEGQFADALGQNLVVEFDVVEDFLVGPEVHVNAALVGVADDLDRRDGETVLLGQFAVLRHATDEFHVVDFAVAADGQLEQFRQRVDARYAHAVQAARDLVGVLVELAAGVQLRHDDFGGRAFRVVLVVHLQAGRHAAAVVGDRDRVVRVDGDVDFRAVAGQRFVDRVVQHFEHQVVQAGAVRGVADVHAGTLAHRFQAFQDLDRRCAVFFGLDRDCRHWILFGDGGHGLLSQITNYWEFQDTATPPRYRGRRVSKQRAGLKCASA